MNDFRRVIIIGCGGHGRVLGDIVLSQPERFELVGFVDRNTDAIGSRIFGVSVLGDDGFLTRNFTPSDVRLINGIGSVRDTTLRRKVFEMFKSLGYEFCPVISNGARLSKRSVFGEGCQIITGAVVQHGCDVGDNTIINTSASVDHDCVIGNHSHIAPGATLSGLVSVGDGTHIGSGATVIQGLRIGEGCLVAAGAVVVSDVPAGSIAMGVPARITARQVSI
ncbi:MAG: acetyltransferase [Synergistaceae bacterium]|jgi:UDP-perosamine 4-acetyltransferase|nr:acetyltransferase [Synergistaceae bacterium]